MKLNRSSATRVTFTSAVFALALFGLPSVAKSDRIVAASAPVELARAEDVLLPAEPVVTAESESVSSFDESAWQDADLGNIDHKVFGIALEAAASAVERGDAVNPGTLTVIDFSKPSTEERMWVFDLRHAQVALRGSRFARPGKRPDNGDRVLERAREQ